jgi:hypothetical protein
MKIKGLILSLTAACIVGTVAAQENDDMYFSSKDRAKLNAKRAVENTARYSATANVEDEPEEEIVNPTDSYSARNVNPEYVSRSNSEVAQSDNEDYFVTDYRYANANNFNDFNNNYNNWANSQWYNNSYYGRPMNSPASYYYNSWNNPWSSPYYQSGWYGSLSYYSGSPYYGNSWGYGNSWDYGYGGWGNPYYGNYGGGWGSSWSMGMGMGYGYGGGWGGGYYGRPNVIIINEGGGRGAVYGKRPTRGGSMAYGQQNSGARTRSQVTGRTGNGTPSSGRVATSTGRTQDEYYNRTWRRTSEYSNQNSNNSRSNSNSGFSNSRTNSNSSWDNNNSNNSNSRTNTFERSNSNSNSGFSGGSRSSSGSSSSGSGSGGRTRGRD